MGTKKTQSKVRCQGLAPVMGYEPWFGRCLEGIKQSISDGHPVLIRLHSAAAYPAETTTLYRNDVESHAVMVVGYDDEQGAVEIVDPWNREWGGEMGGRHWLSYSDLSLSNVDSSLGTLINLAPLEVRALGERKTNGELLVHISAGFYSPRCKVMDQNSWTIEQIDVSCQCPSHWNANVVSKVEKGSWTVGDQAKFTVEIPGASRSGGECTLEIRAVIKGDRPYAFQDIVSVTRELHIAPQSVDQATETKKVLVGV
jgi:Peptidase_C39 like family